MQKRAGSRVSIRNVAAAAGVSLGSVSRVLNKSGYTSPELKQQVLTAVEALGYEPDLNAKYMRTGSSKTIGYLLQDIANPFLGLHLSAVETIIQASGYSLLIGTSEQEAIDRRHISFFRNRRLDGIIASPGREYDDPATCPFVASALPVVIVDRDMAGDFDFVKIDHAHGMRSAMDYLFALGHRRIALLVSSARLRPGREKLVGYRLALEAAGLPFDPQLLYMPDSWIASSSNAMRSMLTLADPPTAVIAVGTPLLSGAVRVIRDAGMEIPGNISVIGIGAVETLELMYPPATAVRYNVKQSAELVVGLMMDRLLGTAAPHTRVRFVQPELVMGGSCGPRRRSRKTMRDKSGS